MAKEDLIPYVKGQSGNPINKINYERGIWQYQNDRPKCVKCGLLARYHTKNQDGSIKYWRKYCTMCHKNISHKEKYGYRLNKKKYCENCGFIAIHPVQLDVDHINGNHKDNREENLKTLCANCHRLKTVVHGNHNGIKYVLNEK
jgi:ribosomal protein L33